MNCQESNKLQADLIHEIDPEEKNERDVHFIECFAKDMRNIIESYEVNTGKKLTKDDLIWCLSYDRHCNIREEIFNLGEK